MKRTIALGISFVFLIPFLLFAAGKVIVTKTENTATKRVEFDHNKHRAKGVAQCAICHHKGKVGQACAYSGCHAGAAGTKAVHDRCIGCHRTKGGNAPQKCVQCHNK
ncbi:MAG: hypothetical protein N2316_10250 [Spirochaetes bacterium]|nr:hypothetical protein [Spirochaetota bacterium]